MKKKILCAKCKTIIGIEESGRARDYFHNESYFFYNTIMSNNYGGELCDGKLCKNCYEEVLKEIKESY